MGMLEALPSYLEEAAQRTIVLEAQNGETRRELLKQWVEVSRAQGAHAFFLDCDFDQSGLWAGLNDFLWLAISELRQTRPDLIEQHSYELAVVFPTLRRSMKIRNESLTDSGPANERTRNFSVDRAYRIVHGLINLLEEWYRLHGKGPLVFACDTFDNAGSLVKRFFAQLLRRRGHDLRITTLLSGNPGSADTFLKLWATPAEKVVLDLPHDPPAAMPREQIELRAEELEQRALQDTTELQIVLPELIRCLRQLDDHERTVKWQSVAFGVYNHFGFYEDSFRYSQVVEENLDHISRQEYPFYWKMTRWNLVGNLFGCYIGCNEIEKAYRVVKKEALEKIDNPLDTPRIYWVMSMLYTRYLPEKDFDKAADYLERGLKVLDEHEYPPSHRHFLTTFLENGLALVRYRQGRSREAIELCQRGFERLQTHLPPSQHRLHRSVLLYNMAQVYTSLGERDLAIRYYTEAMAIDPEYSEYYNERGNLYLQEGRLAEAIADYQKAIELSSPYQEVWTNLGQAYRQLGHFDEAVKAYTHAIDLDPDQFLSRVGRAQSCEALGNALAAFTDYTKALEIDPTSALTWANRAVLHYEAGRVADSLTDLDTAIKLSPDNPELYENRAVALTDLGRHREALQDLEQCLCLYTDVSDLHRVSERLTDLRHVA